MWIKPPPYLTSPYSLCQPTLPLSSTPPPCARDYFHRGELLAIIEEEEDFKDGEEAEEGDEDRPLARGERESPVLLQG